MNNRTPVKETASDVVLALVLFLICIIIAFYYDAGSLAAYYVFE